MGRRGRKSLVKKVLGQIRAPADPEVARKLLKECLASLDKHPYIWLIDYDVPVRARKTFYRNMKRLNLHTIESTSSVFKVRSLKDALAVKALAELCEGRANVYLAIEF